MQFPLLSAVRLGLVLRKCYDYNDNEYPEDHIKIETTVVVASAVVASTVVVVALHFRFPPFAVDGIYYAYNVNFVQGGIFNNISQFKNPDIYFKLNLPSGNGLRFVHPITAVINGIRHRAHTVIIFLIQAI